MYMYTSVCRIYHINYIYIYIYVCVYTVYMYSVHCTHTYRRPNH